MKTYDVALVGAGPIGLEMAVALKRRGVDYVHFEARQIGHTLTWWAPQTRFFSSNERIAIAGVPLVTPDGGKATREQYLAYLRTVVQLFDLAVRTYEPVTGIRRSAAGEFVLTTAARDGTRTYPARRVILATGGTERPHRLGIPGEDLPHVSHYLADPHTYFGQRLLIVGGKNSAAEAALRCHHAGARVSLSYRRAELPAKSIKYWLYPELTGLLRTGGITPLFETQPVSISTTDVHLRRADGRVEAVPADFVLLLTGYEADMALFRQAGVGLLGPNEVPTFDPETMETDVPGLYVAGTAAAGTQSRYELFIENCHTHVSRILTHLTGDPAPDRPASELARAMPES